VRIVWKVKQRIMMRAIAQRESPWVSMREFIKHSKIYQGIKMKISLSLLCQFWELANDLTTTIMYAIQWRVELAQWELNRTNSVQWLTPVFNIKRKRSTSYTASFINQTIFKRWWWLIQISNTLLYLPIRNRSMT